MQLDYMMFAEIAKVVGVTRQRVSQLAHSDPDAPEIAKVGDRTVGIRRAQALSWMARKWPGRLMLQAGDR